MFLTVYFIVFFTLFFFHFILGLTSFFHSYGEFLIGFYLGIFSNSPLYIHIILDLLSSQFISFVALISSVVVFYRVFYMSSDVNNVRFLILLLLFVASIFFLILSPSLLGLIVGWDGLGITSFLLVVYYNNVSSLRSGLITVYTNRLGDIFLIFALYYLFSYGWMGLDALLLIYGPAPVFFITIAGITKRAQLPFSSWLPAAIAAPTPVSSLVHSSTLVTAGVFMFIRFFFIFDGFILMRLFLYISLITSLTAGIMACIEVDLKKLVAISTLRQLGIIISSLSLGCFFYSFFHMVRHALFKSLLFLRCGFLILIRLGSQDMRFKGNKFFSVVSLLLLIVVANLSLCGFPFLAGFFSKDLIIEIFFTLSFDSFSVLMLFLCCVLSIIYSFKLLFFSSFGASLCSSSSINIFSSHKFFLISFLFLWSICLGKFFRLLFLEGEVRIFYFFDKSVGVLFFLIFFMWFILPPLLSPLMFYDIIWLNWSFGPMLSNTQSSSYLVLIGESFWLEFIGPRGLVFLVVDKLFFFLNWGVVKNLIFLFVFILVISMLLPISLFKSVVLKRQRGTVNKTFFSPPFCLP